MAGLADLVVLAKDYGVFEFYLPFIILFALFYGLLNKIKLFGDPFEGKSGEVRMARSINLIFSLAAAFFLMAYTPVGITLTEFFATMFTQTTIVITTLVSTGIIVYLLMAVIGKRPEDIVGETGGVIKLVAIIGGLIAIGIFISSGGLSIFPGLGEGTLPSSLGISTQDAMVLGLILLTAIAMYWIVHEPKEKKPKAAPQQTV